MAGGPAGFNLGFSCPDLLRILLTCTHFTCTGFSPSVTGLSMPFQFFACSYVAVLLPPSRRNVMGLGCAAFARHYLRYHCCFLFLLLLRCFSSEGSLLVSRYHCWWVAPFGYSRIVGHLHLPATFRSLSRPSSPCRA